MVKIEGETGIFLKDLISSMLSNNVKQVLAEEVERTIELLFGAV